MTNKPTAELIAWLKDEALLSLDNAEYFSNKSSEDVDVPTQRAYEESVHECRKLHDNFIQTADRLAEQQKVIDDFTPRPIDEAAKHHELPLILYAPKQPPVLGWWVEEDGKWRMPNFMNGEYMGSMAGRSAIRQPTHYLPIPKALQPKAEVDNA